MPYYPIGNGTIITPQWFNDIQNRLYNSDTGEYKQWSDTDLSDQSGQIKDRLATLSNEFKVTGVTGLYANYNGGTYRDVNNATVTLTSGSVLCTDNTTNYIYLTKNGVVASNSLAGMPLASLVFSSGSLVSNTDLRSRWLLFDPSDLQAVVYTKTTSFKVNGAGLYLITPSATVSISLPVSPTEGFSCYFIVDHNASQSVSLNQGNTINGSTNSITLETRFVYRLLYFSSNVGWYLSAYPIGQALKSTAHIQDMPNSLVAGKILAVDDTGTRYQLSDAINNNWTVVNTTYTTKTGEKVFADTTNGAFTISLPAGAVAGNYLEIFGSFSTNSLTVSRNGATIDGQIKNLVLSSDKQITRLIHSGTTWISSAGSLSDESTSGTAGTPGIANSIYTSTLLAYATQGTGYTLNSSTKLALLAYARADNKMVLQPAILSNADIWTFYKETVFADTVGDIDIQRVSDDTAIVAYHIPSTDTVVLRLLQISTSGVVLLSQSNISQATTSNAGILFGNPNKLATCYDSNKYMIATNSGVYFYSISGDAFTLLTSATWSADPYAGITPLMYAPHTVVSNGRYWYATGLQQQNHATQLWWTGCYIAIDSTTNLVVANTSGDSIASIFKDSTNKVTIQRHAREKWTSNDTTLSHLSQLTTSSPFYSFTSQGGTPLIYHNITGNTPGDRYGLRTTRIGDKIASVMPSGTQTILGNQNTSDGSVSFSPPSNLLGLGSPSTTYARFGQITSTKACIITNGIAAIVYL